MSNEISIIVSAIEHEANLSSQPLDWTICKSERHGRLWKVFVKPNEHAAQLDESLEGASAWWPGPPRGSGDVLSLVPEDLQINLRLATSDVPLGGLIRIYPIRFLDKLAEVWSSPFLGPRIYGAHEELKENSPAPLFASPSPGLFGELRSAQRASFGLLGYRFSFLWGPPGTGKTHTLGAMLASFMVENPTARVLLVSTTNSAVDLALVSVDKALERLSKSVSNASNCRQECKRVGAHFVAQHYQDRQHLIPRTNDGVIRRLAESEANRPDAGDVAAYDTWKSKNEELRTQVRAQVREVLLSSRLTALTCTLGIFSYSDLAEIGSFDLVVFDEASQVSLAHALPFLPLAKRVLFAGDPQQLEPIVVADRHDVKEWLGRSPFEYMRKIQANTTILTEQSRMGADICRVVAETFYDGKLKVCLKAASDAGWKADRRLQSVPKLSSEPLCCIDVLTDGGFHARFGGYMRDESAERIVLGVQAALSESGALPADIAVLTPYRAQRTVIRKKLKKAGIHGVQVSTVHRAQGTERRTIFFDPVYGTHKALTDRLINVALSRAKARLVVAFSKGDLKNTRLARVRALMKFDASRKDATPLGEILRADKPPKNTSGGKVSYAGKIYVFEGITASGEKVKLRDCSTGKLAEYLKSVILAKTEA